MGARLRQDEDLDEVAGADRDDEEQDDRLDRAHAVPLEREQEEDVQPGDDDRPEERNMEEQVERDRAPQDLREIARGDGDLAQEPVGPAGPSRVPVAARLCEILPGDHPQARRERLHEDGHEAGESDDPEEAVLVLRSRLEIRPPVAGVHVADADENRGPHEGPPLPEEPLGMMGDGDGAVDALEGGMAHALRLVRGFVSGKGFHAAFTNTRPARGRPMTCVLDPTRMVSGPSKGSFFTRLTVAPGTKRREAR